MIHFQLEDEEAAALMQCASVGAAAAQVLLGINARPMRPIFDKIQAQAEASVPRPAANGKDAELSR